MNILELCMSPGLGGLELYVYRSSIELSNSESGDDPVGNPRGNNVIAVLQKGSKLDDYYEKNSSIKTCHLKPFFRPLPLINAFRLARIIDKNKIDVIHMHWGKDLPLASLAKFFSKKKPGLVYTRQMMMTRNKKDLYHRLLYSQLDIMLTITQQLENLCKQFLPGNHIKVQTLYYGVKPPAKILDEIKKHEIRQQIGFNDNDFVVGLFGRLEQVKGQHLLIEALAEAKAQNKIIKALIVGHEMLPGYRDTLRGLAQEQQVVEQIIFNDFVENPQQLMQICDCICLTTYEETFGLVLPEAMRAGVAVIGSNKGGVPEIIEHKKTGLLFESGNSSSLSKQLVYLYDNPDERSLLSANGQQLADNKFSIKQHYSALRDTYTSLLKR